MFPTPNKREWEPRKIREKRSVKLVDAKAGSPTVSSPNATTIDKGDDNNDDVVILNSESKGDTKMETERQDVEFEEDAEPDEGAVYPLEEGRVVNWPCFLALLTHVHKTLGPPFHTPILLITQPAWTAKDKEMIAQFCFEKFRTPGFCMMDAAHAVCYAYGVPLATVIDVGYQKCDITAVVDFLAHDVGRGIAIENCGGEAMTQRLLELLGPQRWTADMCEQLKKSNICEILSKGVPLPGAEETDSDVIGLTILGSGMRGNIADESATATDSIAAINIAEGSMSIEGTTAVESNDGVLDVASIVASGKTAEFLARKEREKAEKTAKKGGAADSAAAAAKPIKLPNFRREKNTFIYEGPRRRASKSDKLVSTQDAEPDSAGDGTTLGSAVDQTNQEKVAKDNREEREKAFDVDADGQEVVQREVEVGIERFRAGECGIIETIADAIHRTILSIEEVSRRAELWDNLIIVGNGSKVRGEFFLLINPSYPLLHPPPPSLFFRRHLFRGINEYKVLSMVGFKDALVSTLISKYLISPSSATIFTSELPSQLSTPLATGANTPQLQAQVSGGGGGGGGGGGSHVNPLLLAATTASNPAFHGHASVTQAITANQTHNSGQHQIHSSHGQTPTSIKITKPTDYFPEWKDVGYEDAVFLGAQLAAKVVFVVDQGITKGFMNRSEYNEMGPQGIHEFSL